MSTLYLQNFFTICSMVRSRLDDPALKLPLYSLMRFWRKDLVSSSKFWWILSKRNTKERQKALHNASMVLAYRFVIFLWIGWMMLLHQLSGYSMFVGSTCVCNSLLRFFHLLGVPGCCQCPELFLSSCFWGPYPPSSRLIAASTYVSKKIARCCRWADGGVSWLNVWPSGLNLLRTERVAKEVAAMTIFLLDAKSRRRFPSSLFSSLSCPRYIT